MAFRVDDNISDGLQIYGLSVESTTTTSNGINYEVDLISTDGTQDPPPLMMTRQGNWLSLDAPQVFGSTSNALEAQVVSDGSGGAFLLHGQDTGPGVNPEDFSVIYAVWSDRTAPVDIADMLGTWQMVQYGNLNLLSDDVFMLETITFTVTSPAPNKLTLSGIGPDPAIFTVVGNEVVPDDPSLFTDAKVLITRQGNFVYGNIGVEDFDPTDISLTIGMARRIPGDTDFDGDIDDADLGTAFANYTGPGAPGIGGKTHADGDTDNDGDVDDADLGATFAAYTGPLSPGVPEPASAALLALAGAGLLRRRRVPCIVKSLRM